MKKYKLYILLILLFNFFNGLSQEWIPFEWVGDSIGNRYFDKLAISIPVKIDSISYNFKMQLDLGATQTHFYENNLKELFNSHPFLKHKIDTSYIFWINKSKNPYIKNCRLTLGNYKLQNRYIGLYKNFGTNIPVDSLTKCPLIGTIGTDIFENKILIIDYPNNRIGIFENLPEEYNNSSFSKFEEKYGRILIHFLINGKDERLMFDTGSSIFGILTTKKKAKKITSKPIVDELAVNSWGNNLKVYGKKIIKPILLKDKPIDTDIAYYTTSFKYKVLYRILKIWGVTGNSLFLKNTIIFNYKTLQFGVK